MAQYNYMICLFTLYIYQEMQDADLNRITREVEEKTREMEEKTREVEEKTRELQVSICNF